MDALIAAAASGGESFDLGLMVALRTPVGLDAGGIGRAAGVTGDCSA